jgi:hypothetical protein
VRIPPSLSASTLQTALISFRANKRRERPVNLDQNWPRRARERAWANRLSAMWSGRPPVKGWGCEKGIFVVASVIG